MSEKQHTWHDVQNQAIIVFYGALISALVLGFLALRYGFQFLSCALLIVSALMGITMIAATFAHFADWWQRRK